MVHLGSVPIVMANYRVAGGWLFGSASISQRLPDIEPCSGFETLGTHLGLSSAQSSDVLAVNSVDAQAIRRALRD